MDRIASFDIFDTCLTRLCGNPDYVFDLVGREIMPNAEESQIFDFSLERKNGYGRAIAKYTNPENEDVTLEQIYTCCDFSDLGICCTIDKLVNVELSIEKSILVPIYDTLNLINEFRKQNTKIIFISDMYLPSDFIEKLMREYGYMIDGDKLYVSNKYGRTKSTGSLYDYVKNDLNIEKKSWCHFGDSKYSDYKAAKKFGIRAKLINYPYLHYEKALQRKDYTSRIRIGDIMAGVSRAIRLQEARDTKVTFVATIIAPIFVPFVYSILCDAKKRGIEHLYFLARDAKIFYDIAEALMSQFPNISIHYLCVSRSSLYLPGLKDVSLNSLLEIFPSVEWQGTRDILEKLHMLNYVVPSSIANKYGAKEILPVLLSDKRFKDQLEDVRLEQQKLCYDYFKQEGLSRENSAIVDLNGSRRCHRAINYVLTSFGANPVFGYYLEVLGRKPGGGYKSLNFVERSSKQYSFAPIFLIEQYFCVTPFNRTSGYKKNGSLIEPIYEVDNTNVSKRRDVYNAHKLVIQRFADAYGKILCNEDHERCCELAISVLTEFFNYPKKELLKEIEDFEFTDSAVRSMTLLTKESLWKTLRSRKRNPWLYGNIVNASHVPEFWRMLLKWNVQRKS